MIVEILLVAVLVVAVGVCLMLMWVLARHLTEGGQSAGRVDVGPKTCASCRYYADSERNIGGQCRLRPPIESSVTIHKWPAVHATDWCGEYKRGGK